MTEPRIALYFRARPETDRWLRGDRHVRPLVRRIVRGRPRPGGVDKVLINLCAGLRELGVQYDINPPFASLQEGDRIGVLGRGREVLSGYDRGFPIVAGIGLMTHPSEWPTLCDEYPVVTYLSHSEWVNKQYVPYYGDRCRIWPVGIDTQLWRPDPSVRKTVDFLVYDKIPRPSDATGETLRASTLDTLAKCGLSFKVLTYGRYQPSDFRSGLLRARALLFLSPHESQGIACGEALSSDVPVLAWDPEKWTDPNRFEWGEADAVATSVPYFDDRCGVRFRGPSDFHDSLTRFLRLRDGGELKPREYMIENLTLAASARRFIDHLDEAQSAEAQRRISPLASRRAT